MSDETAALNRDVWTRKNAEYADGSAERDWAEPEIVWGLFSIPESQLQILGDVADLDVVELGCGTAYFSSWFARRGSRPVGVDINAAQLATARRCQQQSGLSFPLIEANAERVPLPDASFDLVLSEYGACLWCEPQLWVPEAARLLRPGGRLVFLTNHVLLSMCLPDNGPATTQLQRGYRAVQRLAWPNEGVEFHLGHGAWIALLAEHGLRVERLEELHVPPPTAASNPYYEIVTPAWGAEWPAEELWVARRER